jgi:hypothetical protein
MDGARHRVKNPPVRRGLFRFLTPQNPVEGVALTLIGALVDYRLHSTVAAIDRTRPCVHEGEIQTIEPDIAEMAAIDAG